MEEYRRPDNAPPQSYNRNDQQPRDGNGRHGNGEQSGYNDRYNQPGYGNNQPGYGNNQPGYGNNQPGYYQLGYNNDHFRLGQSDQRFGQMQRQKFGNMLSIMTPQQRAIVLNRVQPSRG